MVGIISTFLPWKEPEKLTGENSLDQLAPRLQNQDIHRLLIVTDQGIRSIGLMDSFLKNATAHGIHYVIYDQTTPNPTIANVEEATHLFHENNCQAIVAFGGGSPIDCAKVVAAKVAKPNQPVEKMKGLLKIRTKLPKLIAVPTTAGTGSEATLAAVISNPETHEKYPIMDPALFPDQAVLDPMLTIGLPPHLTATTGMDALTHAIEVYIGKHNNRSTREASRKAIELIFGNIYQAYVNGENREARANLLEASYLAGFAFTRSYVGNVHAVALTLGGFYGTPHGLANAVILPHVLEYYGRSVTEPLAELADLVKLGTGSDSSEMKAKRFIERIKELNANMNIPETIADIRDQDIPLMIDRAYHEANPLYPVPKIFTKDDFRRIYQRIQSAH